MTMFGLISRLRPRPTEAPEPPPTIPPDEASRRRPGFREGVAIELADGRSWHFPRPILSYRLEFPANGPAVVGLPRFGDGGARDFGADYWSKYRALAEAETIEDRLPALGAVAADLLSRNYALDGDELAALLPFHVDVESDEGEANIAMWQAIAGVIEGVGPKAGTAGDGSP